MNETHVSRADIVVPVHGGWVHVEKCLQSLRLQTVPCRVIVVGDKSPDDTLARVRTAFPDFEVFANDENSGFAKTCNRGIRLSSSPIVVLLNSDVVAAPTLVETIVEAMSEMPTAGSAAAVLLDQEGWVDSFGMAGDCTLATYVRFHGARRDDVSASDPVVLGPYGAVAAYRRKALDEVGLLDENIFMYGEEAELNLRLGAAGWAAIAVDEVVGTHVGGASAGLGSPRQRYLAEFGRGYTMRVYGVLSGRHAVRAATIELIVFVASLLTQKDLSGFRGRRAGWRAGRGVPRRSARGAGLDESIDLRTSIAMRRPNYWLTHRPRSADPKELT